MQTEQDLADVLAIHVAHFSADQLGELALGLPGQPSVSPEELAAAWAHDLVQILGLDFFREDLWRSAEIQVQIFLGCIG